MTSGITEFATIRFGNIDVSYFHRLDGGGKDFGQDYVRLVRTLPAKPRRVFEWCAGPGFIGFSLLAHGLCDSLCLADINPDAIEACRHTVAKNGLEDRVTIYQSDGLDSINTCERWDLVVGNPPHSGTGHLIPEWGNLTWIYMDRGWELHKRFWRDVPKFLNPGGAVLIQENSEKSRVSDFATTIEENGMRISYVAELGVPFTDIAIYYIGAVRMADAAGLRGIGLAQRW